MMNYWLMKSEPDVFGIDDLAARPDQTEPWNGVRNYQVRNWLRDSIQVGDLAFFYHSNTATPAIMGIMEVVRAGYPEPNQDKPTWFCVDVKYVRHLARPIALAELRQYADSHLQHFSLLQKGSRLSIVPMTQDQWDFILHLV